MYKALFLKDFVRAPGFLAAVFLLSALIGATPGAAQPDTHVALIFGNSNYREFGILKNPKNDADDLSVALAQIGYEVETVQDATYNQMRDALQKFARKALKAEIAIIYFAGHGIEVDRENFLIPVDAVLETDQEVEFQTISLNMMQRAVSGASKLKVVLLDACRNNPFLRQMRSIRGAASRSTLSGGLAALEPETGTLVGFSAKEGTTASDGEGRNSPYTAALLKYITEPNRDVGRMFRKVRDDVLTATGRSQEPFVYGSLPGGDVFLHSVPTVQQTAPKPAVAATVPQAAKLNPALAEARLAWDAVKDSETLSDFEFIIANYSDTFYAKLAEGRKRQLEKQASAPPTASPGGSDRNNNLPIKTTAPAKWYLATYANLDLFGGDIVKNGIRTYSATDCAQRCGNELSCRAFTFNSKANRCFLKSSYDYAQIYDGAVAGYMFKGSSPDDAPVIPAKWELFEKSDLGGRDIGSSNDRTFTDCLDTCTSTASCSGVAFIGYAKRNRCWLKSGDTYGPIYSANARRGILAARHINKQVSPSRVNAIGIAQ
jgi:uncharacterized caspase-like protein